MKNLIIRIQQSEYDEIPESGFYTHFNLGSAPHAPGTVYALPRIIKHGQNEIDPVLSFENIINAKCIGVKIAVPVDSVTEEDFKYSMCGIKNTESLKERILYRYTKGRPQLSKEEMLNMGVTVTYLEIKNQ